MTKSLLVLAVLATPAFADSNRAIVEKDLAIADSKQHFERFAEVEAADAEIVMPSGTFKGPQQHAQMAKMFATAMPNYKHTLGQCVEQGEWISCEGTFSGDNKGPLPMPDGKTLPATGKHVEFSFVGIGRIKAGKMQQLHVYYDTAVMFTQLGLMPRP